MTQSSLPPDQAAAMSGSIFWYAVAVFPWLESAGDKEALEVANACQDISGEWALHLSATKKFDLPHVGAKSSFWILAYMSAYIVWRMSKAGPVDNLPDSPFLTTARDAFRFYPLLHSEKKYKHI